MSNDIRKNKNKINICESDISSIRDRLTNINVEKNNNNNNNNNNNDTDFASILGKLGGMNNNIFNHSEYMEEADITEEEDESVENEEEDESEENAEEEESVENEEEDESEENADEDSVENVEAESVSKDDAIVEENLPVVEEQPKVVQEQEVSKNKLPKKPLTSLKVGDIEPSTDGKAQYSVQLNKLGRKYWKKV